jgi:hypothetical protein
MLCEIAAHVRGQRRPIAECDSHHNARPAQSNVGAWWWCRVGGYNCARHIASRNLRGMREASPKPLRRTTWITPEGPQRELKQVPVADVSAHRGTIASRTMSNSAVGSRWLADQLGIQRSFILETTIVSSAKWFRFALVGASGLLVFQRWSNGAHSNILRLLHLLTPQRGPGRIAVGLKWFESLN